MNLFDRIPENIFSVLASKNKRIYFNTLMTIREAFKIHLVIERDDLVNMIVSVLENDMELYFEPEDEEEILIRDLHDKANFLVRKLIRIGWINTEFQGNTFESIITIPDYSVALMNVLHDLQEMGREEYNSLVVSTYNNLKMADNNRDEFTYTALDGAYKSTIKLLDLLKSLHNNIGKYHKKVLESTEVNEIITLHFDDFKSYILDQVYHPLKTFDSAPRFKGPILEILNTWSEDPHVKEKMMRQAMRYNAYGDEAGALNGINEKIVFLQQSYENISDIMRDIDIKNSKYTAATIEKIQYLVNRDQSIKGNLVDLLKLAAEDSLDIDLVNYRIKLYQQEYVNRNSLFARAKIKSSKLENPIAVKSLSQTVKDEMISTFTSSLQNQYSMHKIQEYMLAMLETSDLSVEDLEIEDIETFVKIMLATLRGLQTESPFQVEFLSGNVDKENFTLPSMIYQKKVK